MNESSHSGHPRGGRLDPETRAWKTATRAELENYFRSRRSPRVTLAAILMLTGMAGLACCHGLLHLGLLAMWLRYPLAVLGGYGCFLLLVRGWVAWEHFRFDHRALHLPTPPADAEWVGNAADEPPRSDPVKPYQKKSDWWEWLDIGDFDFIPDGEGCLIGILLAVGIALLAIAGLAVADAPVLIADVFLDSVLVTALYRSLRKSNSNQWLGTAIRRTYSRALWLALLLAVAGACLQGLAPGCHSIGPALKKILAL